MRKYSWKKWRLAVLGEQPSFRGYRRRMSSSRRNQRTGRSMVSQVGGNEMTVRVILCLIVALALLVALPVGSARATGGGFIDNGIIQLGVHDEGHLNVPGGPPSSGTGTTDVGLRYLPTGAEFTAPGCLCEGWGAADAISGESGAANEAVDGVVNMTPVSSSFTTSTAVTVVDIGTTLRVTHDYHPSITPNLYEVTVTLENISASTVEPLYRRVMDWDVEPTAFSEFSTIQGTAAASNVLFASDDGFASANPLTGSSSILFTGDAVDSGPTDHGALFDFGFDPLAPGESVSFFTFYGAAATEAEADAALAAVQAEVFSYGQPDTTDGATLGTPNTAIFAFAAVGGEPVFPSVSFSSSAYSVGEADGSATITVELSSASDGPVSVDYDASGGTATAGSDFTAVSGTLVFSPGETSKTFPVPVLDDSADEPDETVLLSLSNFVGAFAGSPIEATLTIVDDDDGGPSNVPPVVDAGGDVSGGEGSAIALDGTVSDADGDSLTVLWSYSAGLDVDAGASCSFADASAVDTSITCSDDGTYTATLTADDGVNPPVSDSTSVTVTNVAPSVSITSPADGSSYPLGAAVSVVAGFSDPGSNDTHTCEIDWGDGTVEAGAVVGGECTGSHSYAAAGVFSIVVSVTDDDGGVGSDEIMVVVFDEATKVTGGGFVIDGGRTSFGFVARNEGGVFSGQLQVRAPGKHKFHGDTVTSLAVSGKTATWSGEGRWDGMSGYTFEVSVVDNRNGGGKSAKKGAPDQISIVIRDSSGAVVFSAGPADLKGGNIKIH